MSKSILPLVTLGFVMRKPASGEPDGPMMSRRARRSSAPWRRSLSLWSSSVKTRPVCARTLVKCLRNSVLERDRSMVAMGRLLLSCEDEDRDQAERHVFVHLGAQPVESDRVEQATEGTDLRVVLRRH